MVDQKPRIKMKVSLNMTSYQGSREIINPPTPPVVICFIVLKA